jgi:capsular polysaccharide biosynthesis protein
MTTRDKVRLFAEAEVVAGPHGSGFINCIFSPLGTKLIELHNPYWWDGSTPHYAQLLGHEYWYGFGENASESFDTTFDRHKLERLLDYALGGPSTDPIPY